MRVLKLINDVVVVRLKKMVVVDIILINIIFWEGVCSLGWI